MISPVSDLNFDYKKSIFYPEKVTIKTWVEKYSRLRSLYCYEVYNEKGELATTGSTELICMKDDNFRPIRLDRYFPDWHATYSRVAELNKEGKEFEVTAGINNL